MKIYTKTGDFGQTSLFGKKCVPKNDLRIESYGTLDELNSWIGLICCSQAATIHRDVLLRVQNQLFVVGANLAVDTDSEIFVKRTPALAETDITFLEHHIDSMQSSLAELSAFILPGGHEVASQCHIARTVCRRAERLVTPLVQTEIRLGICLKYLNRLSDFLFVLARKICHEQNSKELYWKS